MIAPPHGPLHIVDSSGWIEYFTDSPNADEFAAVIEEPGNLLVPSLSILEVFKWVLRERGEDLGFQITAVMQQAEVIELDVTLALRSAKLGLADQLPLADSVMYATAQALGATLWTQDADLENLPGVRYLPKRRA